MSRGRMFSRGLTMRSAVLTVAVVIVALILVGVLVRVLQPKFPMEVRVLDHQLVDTDTGCAWEFELEMTNESDRRLSVVSIELTDIPGSARMILAAVAPGETEVRAYRHPLTDCSAEPDIGTAGDLRVVYGPSASSIERSVTIELA